MERRHRGDERLEWVGGSNALPDLGPRGEERVHCRSRFHVTAQVTRQHVSKEPWRETTRSIGVQHERFFRQRLTVSAQHPEGRDVTFDVGTAFEAHAAVDEQGQHLGVKRFRCVLREAAPDVGEANER